MTPKKYEFKIIGYLPPKKGMDLSMFGKPGEAEKLIALRIVALEAMQGDPHLTSNIRLTLMVHVGPINNRMTGDLDSFIAGICDGLMAASPDAKIDSAFDDPDLKPIHPSKTIAIEDDSQVIGITARKVISDEQTPWYEVILEGI